MNRELLPLCAVLTGNDYGAPREAATLLERIDVSALGRGGGRGKGRAPSSRIEGLLIWLSSFSNVAEALDEVSRIMGEESVRGKRGQRGGLSSQLWAAMQEYHINPQSSLAHWFSEGKAVMGGKSSGPAQLPEYLSLAAAQGHLAPLALDALVMQRVLLIPQVENCKLASSHCVSRAIRQAIYGILLQKGQDSTHGRSGGTQLVKGAQGGIQMQETRGGRGRGGRGQSHAPQQGKNMDLAAGVALVQTQGSSTPVSVEEYDRLDLNLKKNQVEANAPRNPLHLEGLCQVNINSFQLYLLGYILLLRNCAYNLICFPMLIPHFIQAPVAVRLCILLEVFGVKESALAPVPYHLQLAVAVTGFWFREAKPTPSQPLLQALMLGMIYGELSLNNQLGATRQHHTG